MKTWLKICIRIIQSIIAIPIGILGAVCLTPIVLLGLLFAIPANLFIEIWNINDGYYGGLE